MISQPGNRLEPHPKRTATRFIPPMGLHLLCRTGLGVFLTVAIGLGAPATNKLEQAVKAGANIHKVNLAAAKLGDKPKDYASPGREKHSKPPPPGKEKKP